MQKKLLFLILVFMLLAGCLPAQTEQDISSLVNTAVAETAQANTQIASFVEQTVAAQQPAFTPTADFSPTPTFESIPLFPDTPVPTFTFTPLPPPPTDEPAVSLVKKDYSCYVETRRPSYYEEIKADTNFEIRWFVVNTGTKAWTAGVDIKYASGTKFTGPERVEIPVALAPGETYKLSLTGKAPGKSGNYTMSWIVEGQLCFANVAISVK